MRVLLPQLRITRRLHVRIQRKIELRKIIGVIDVNTGQLRLRRWLHRRAWRDRVRAGGLGRDGFDDLCGRLGGRALGGASHQPAHHNSDNRAKRGISLSHRANIITHATPTHALSTARHRYREYMAACVASAAHTAEVVSPGQGPPSGAYHVPPPGLEPGTKEL